VELRDNVSTGVDRMGAYPSARYHEQGNGQHNDDEYRDEDEGWDTSKSHVRPPVSVP